MAHYPPPIADYDYFNSGAFSTSQVSASTAVPIYLSSITVSGTSDFIGDVKCDSITASRVVVTTAGQILNESTLTSANADTLQSGLTGSSISFATSGTLTTGAITSNSSITSTGST